MKNDNLGGESAKTVAIIVCILLLLVAAFFVPAAVGVGELRDRQEQAAR